MQIQMAVKLVVLKSKHPVCALCLTQCAFKDKSEYKGWRGRGLRREILMLFAGIC